MSGLVVEGLTVRYGRAVAVAGASFEVPAGSVTALVGANGAGKSSALLATFGSIRASGGRVLLDGTDLSGHSAARRARAGVAVVPQGRQLFPRLTVRDNLMVAAEHLRLPRSEVEAAELRFPILADRRRSLAGVLSGGEQQMLAVTRALMGRPKVLLLDELVTGLAPKIVQELVTTVRGLAADGLAVVVAAPELTGLRDVVSNGYVLVRGEVVAATTDGRSLQRAYEAALGVTV